MAVTKVDPKYNGKEELARRAAMRDREQRKILSNYLYGEVMDNKVKSAIAIVLGAIVQLLRLFGVVDIPDFIIDAATAVLAFIAGLFLPQPGSNGKR